MLQQPEADDFVIATGAQYSVREFVEAAANELGMAVEWRGQGLDEVGVDRKSGKTVVRIDPRYFRPTEVDTLLGDASKAKARLGWEPETPFAQLVQEMTAGDLEIARRDAHALESGFKLTNRHADH